jgi:hypothetical protein
MQKRKLGNGNLEVSPASRGCSISHRQNDAELCVAA